MGQITNVAAGSGDSMSPLAPGLRADDAVVRRARAKFVVAAEDLLDDPSTCGVMAVLEAAGRLARLDRVPRLEPGMLAVMEREIPSLDFAGLDDASVDLLMAVECARSENEPEATEAMEAASAALSICRRFALLWTGAEALGLSDAFSAEAWASRLAFEEFLEQELRGDESRL
jgi:hypothetical protein